MTETERQAYGFFLRRTYLDDRDEPRDVKDKLTLTTEEQAAVSALRRLYVERQQRTVAGLQARHPHLPWLLGAIRRLDEGKLLSGWSRRHLASEIKDALRKLEEANERKAEYGGWRATAIEGERRRHGLSARLVVHTRERTGRNVDEEGLRLCPGCEQLFPLTEEERTSAWRDPQCSHCGRTEDLLRPSKGEAHRLLALDDDGVWQVRHRPLPGWARLKEPIARQEEEQP